MSDKVKKTGLAFGLNKGFLITKVPDRKVQNRPALRKGKLGKRVAFIREIVREVAGFAPYEKRIIELLKTSNAKDQKKALKIAKRRLGTQRRAKRKREELINVVAQQKKKHH